jgi:hypothetical protein
MMVLHAAALTGEVNAVVSPKSLLHRKSEIKGGATSLLPKIKVRLSSGSRHGSEPNHCGLPVHHKTRPTMRHLDSGASKTG